MFQFVLFSLSVFRLLIYQIERNPLLPGSMSADDDAGGE